MALLGPLYRELHSANTDYEAMQTSTSRAEDQQLDCGFTATSLFQILNFLFVFDNNSITDDESSDEDE